MDTKQTLSTYRDWGFVRIRRFFSPNEVYEIRAAIDRYIRERLSILPEGDRVLEQDGRSVCNLWRMEQHDPFFRSLADRPVITQLVAELVNGDPVLIAVETFNKPPKVGSGVPFHQDNAYFCQAPPDVLTIWLAVDAVSTENGAVYYLPGSHKLGLLPHRASGVRGNSIGLAEPPEQARQREFCETLEPGDVMIHHCQTVHRSGPNTTDNSRCGLLLVFRGAHTRTDSALKSQYAAALATVS